MKDGEMGERVELQDRPRGGKKVQRETWCGGELDRPTKVRKEVLSAAFLAPSQKQRGCRTKVQHLDPAGQVQRWAPS